jgi:hypothetical protein
MIGIHEDCLLELDAVRGYLAQTAPVPFDFQAFRLGPDVDQYLRRTVPKYATYRIVINDQILYKPYRDTISLSRGPGRTSGHHQRVKDIEYVSLLDRNDSPIAYGWTAKTDLKGTISSDCGVAGIRLKHGNILIGDGNTLEKAFQRSNRRFASFLAGEIHAVHDGLVPNARRDDFESNVTGVALYEAIARQICAPASEAIRHASTLRSQEKKINAAERTRVEAEKGVRGGVVSETQRKEMVEELEASIKGLDRGDPTQRSQIAQIEATAKRIKTEAPHIVDAELHAGLDRRAREVLKVVFDMLYDDYPDKAKAESLIRRIVRRVKTIGSRR